MKKKRKYEHKIEGKIFHTYYRSGDRVIDIDNQDGSIYIVKNVARKKSLEKKGLYHNVVNIVTLEKRAVSMSKLITHKHNPLIDKPNGFYWGLNSMNYWRYTYLKDGVFYGGSLQVWQSESFKKVQRNAPAEDQMK